MKGIKKYICIIPLVFVFLISNVQSIFSSASSDTVPDSVLAQFNFYDSSDFQSKSFIDSELPYFMIRYYTHDDTFLYRSHTVYLEADSNCNISSDSGIYTFDFDERVFFYYACYRNDVAVVGTVSSSSNIAISSNNRSYVDKLIFDTNSNVATFYYQDSVVRSTLDCTFYDFETNLTDIVLGLDLSVSFTPALSGEVDRKIEQNGVEAESNYFSMNITNNSNTNAQFMMCIAPKGSEVTFVSTDTNNTGASFSLSPIYYLMYDEWTYCPTIVAKGLTQGRRTESEYYQTSGWHIVKGSSTYTRSFKWSQINLKKDVEYDVIVLAMPTKFDKPSSVFIYDNCIHYLDLSTGSVVYRSSFTVPNPATYDSTDTEFGNTANTGGLAINDANNNASAYVDSNGEVVVEDINAYDKFEDLKTWEPGIIEKEDGSFSLSDIKANLTMPIDFFNFFMSFFYILPVWVTAALAFSLSALVAIGVIKALL